MIETKMCHEHIKVKILTAYYLILPRHPSAADYNLVREEKKKRAHGNGQEL